MVIGVVAVIALIVIALQYRIYRKNWKKGLVTELHFSKYVAEQNEEFYLTETCINDKNLEISPLRIKYAVDRSIVSGDIQNRNIQGSDKFYFSDGFVAGPYKKITRTIRCKGIKRGVYFIDEVYRSTFDLFMLHEMHDIAKCNAEIKIYPKHLCPENGNYAYETMCGDVINRLRLIEDPFFFRGIREYSMSDNIKNINWKSTAKTGKLMVNEFDSTSWQKVLIALNADEISAFVDEELLEESFRLAVSLAEDLLRRGCHVAMTGNSRNYKSEEELFVDYMSDRESHLEFDIAVAEIDVSIRTDPFLSEERREFLEKSESFLILISMEQSEEIFELLRKRRISGKDFMIIVPENYRNRMSIPEDLIEYSMAWRLNDD